jgi:hypothetical protein
MAEAEPQPAWAITVEGVNEDGSDLFVDGERWIQVWYQGFFDGPTLRSRDEMEQFIAELREAADKVWPPTTNDQAMEWKHGFRSLGMSYDEQLEVALSVPLWAPMSYDELLAVALSGAVPLWIARHKHTPSEARMARARELADIIASKGDLIMFKGGKKGETAAAFNALAEALALAAFQPGGVTFQDAHWDA